MASSVSQTRARRRWFVDRQFLLRSETGVRQIRISRRDQILTTAIGAGLIAWAAATSLSTALFAVRHIETSETIEHLEMGYAQLISRLSRDATDAPDIVGVYQDSPSIGQRLAAHNNLLSTQVEGLEQSLAALRADRNVLAEQMAAVSVTLSETRSSLHGTRSELADANAEIVRLSDATAAATGSRDSALAEVREARALAIRETRRADEAEAHAADLGDQVDELSLAVRSASRTVETVAEERDALLAERETLTASLADANNQVAALTESLDGAQTQITTMISSQDGLAVITDGLTQDLDAARAELADAQTEIAGLTQALDAAQQNAMAITWTRDVLVDAHDALAARVRRSDDELVALQAVQEQFVADLRNRLEVQVEGLQVALATTGLDVDQLVIALNASEAGAAGGPLVPELPDYLLGHDGWTDAHEVLGLAEQTNGLIQVANALPVGRPVTEDTRLSSGFGVRRDPFTGRSARHEGLDFAGAFGLPIYATAPGTVVFAGWRGAYGRLVEVQHAFGLTTRYAHLASIAVEEGQSVGFGTEVGTLGSSGRSTGPHLHYEVRVQSVPRDPMVFLTAGYDVLEITTPE